MLSAKHETLYDVSALKQERNTWRLIGNFSKIPRYQISKNERHSLFWNRKTGTNVSRDFNGVLDNTRKYPLRGYILGVLTHTTTLDSLRGGNNTLKWIYSAWLYLAKYCNVWSSASPHLMGPGGLRVSQTTHFSLLTHAKQLSSVTFCDTTARKWKCDVCTY